MPNLNRHKTYRLENADEIRQRRKLLRLNQTEEQRRKEQARHKRSKEKNKEHDNAARRLKREMLTKTPQTLQRMREGRIYDAASSTRITAEGAVEESIERKSGSIVRRCYRRRKDVGGCTIGRRDIVELWHAQEGRCAITKIHMTTRKRLPWSLSVDRIDPKRGYERDNIRLTCWRPNMMRSDGTDEELVAWCKLVLKGVGRKVETEGV